jgi:hypothetical protein
MSGMEEKQPGTRNMVDRVYGMLTNDKRETRKQRWRRRSNSLDRSSQERQPHMCWLRRKMTTATMRAFAVIAYGRHRNGGIHV